MEKLRKFNRDPLDQAESMIAKVDEMAQTEKPRIAPFHSSAACANVQRPAVQDLLMLSIAQSLRRIAAGVEGIVDTGDY